MEAEEDDKGGRGVSPLCCCCCCYLGRYLGTAATAAALHSLQVSSVWKVCTLYVCTELASSGLLCGPIAH